MRWRVAVSGEVRRDASEVATQRGRPGDITAVLEHVGPVQDPQGFGVDLAVRVRDFEEDGLVLSAFGGRVAVAPGEVPALPVQTCEAGQFDGSVGRYGE